MIGLMRVMLIPHSNKTYSREYSREYLSVLSVVLVLLGAALVLRSRHGTER